jgi:hypothetical protein
MARHLQRKGRIRGIKSSSFRKAEFFIRLLESV